jgi:hypothetical protein
MLNPSSTVRIGGYFMDIKNIKMNAEVSLNKSLGLKVLEIGM